jgi:type III secretion protein D
MFQPEVTAHDTAVADPASWQLVIRSGLHNGAVVVLPEHAWTLLGSAPSCDIVLRDAGVRPHHLALSPRGTQLQLRVVDGELASAQGPHVGGDSWCVAGGQQLQLAGVQIEVLHPAGLSLTHAADRPPASAQAHAGAGEPVLAPAQAAALADGGSARGWLVRLTTLRWRQRWLSMAGLAVAGVALAASLLGGAAALSRSVQDSQALQAEHQLARLVATLQMNELQVTRSATGALRIQGVVHNEAARDQLAQALRREALLPVLDIVTGEHLASVVQNAFRQRGWMVRARYVGEGVVHVDGAPLDDNSHTVVRELLAGHVAVRRVVFGEPAAPPVVAATADKPVAAGVGMAELLKPTRPPGPGQTTKATNTTMDGLRVVGVVGGESAYVLTQDGRRFFVGATLPDGALLEHINDEEVVFVRNGQRMPVRF